MLYPNRSRVYTGKIIFYYFFSLFLSDLRGEDEDQPKPDVDTCTTPPPPIETSESAANPRERCTNPLSRFAHARIVFYSRYYLAILFEFFIQKFTEKISENSSKNSFNYFQNLSCAQK